MLHEFGSPSRKVIVTNQKNETHNKLEKIVCGTCNFTDSQFSMRLALSYVNLKWVERSPFCHVIMERSPFPFCHVIKGRSPFPFCHVMKERSPFPFCHVIKRKVTYAGSVTMKAKVGSTTSYFLAISASAAAAD